MQTKLRLALPKGRITEEVLRLLSSSGIDVLSNGRSYRPLVSDPEIEVKYLKPQNIPKLVEIGAHDCGFTGHDWVMESGSDVVEKLDTGLQPVTLVAAAPEGSAVNFGKLGRPIIGASEYENLTRRYLESLGYPFLFIRTFGATEVYPPEDADVIVDVRDTGTTLKENRLEVIAEVLKSSTRFVASKAALADPWKSQKIGSVETLLLAVIEARRRVLLEVNVSAERLAAVVEALPAMKSPTIQELYGGRGYAVKAAVLRSQLPSVLLKLRELGATDLIAYDLEKVIR